MFICFGFISLVNAYDFFNNQHVPYMKEQLALIDEKTEETKQDTPRLPEQTERVESQDQGGTEEVS